MTLATTLESLRELRAIQKTLESQIKELEAPHLAAAAQASAAHREQLTAVNELVDQTNDRAAALYGAANDARRAALLAGTESPRVPLPSGCSVQERTQARVVDAAAVPRELCAPVQSKVAAALKLGPVAGCERFVKYVFAFRRPAE